MVANVTVKAFWLRSSVVSVLFSLISETFLRELLRLSTFWTYRGPLSLLMPPVSVASIALPLADANLFFTLFISLFACGDVGEDAPVISPIVPPPVMRYRYANHRAYVECRFVYAHPVP